MTWLWLAASWLAAAAVAWPLLRRLTVELMGDDPEAVEAVANAQLGSWRLVALWVATWPYIALLLVLLALLRSCRR